MTAPNITPTTTPTSATSSTSESDARLLKALADLKDALRASESNIGVERSLVRELDRIENQLRQATRTELQGTVDELRLQAHLGVLEAQERFALIEPFLRRVFSSIGLLKDKIADSAAPTAKLQIALGRMDLADFVEERRTRARADLTRAERATERTLEQIGERVHAFAREISKAS